MTTIRRRRFRRASREWWLVIATIGAIALYILATTVLNV